MTKEEPFSNQPPHQKCVNCLYFIRAVDREGLKPIGLFFCRLEPRAMPTRHTAWCGKWKPPHDLDEHGAQLVLEKWIKECDELRLEAEKRRAQAPQISRPLRKSFWRRLLRR